MMIFVEPGGMELEAGTAECGFVGLGATGRSKVCCLRYEGALAPSHLADKDEG